MERVIRTSAAPAIIDLCSGRSGPILPLNAELAGRGVRIPVVLTDKYPDHEFAVGFAQKAELGVTYRRESVDATNVPAGLAGLRTLFNSFHHFRPDQARAILTDAYRNRQPIAIFEITQRTALRVATSFPASFLGVFLLIFLMKPRRPLWWLGTWVVPVIPLVVGWDGLVSHLRSYTPGELLEMTAGMNRDGYRWGTGTVKAPRAGVVVTYLIGTPTPARPERDPRPDSREARS